MPKQIAPADEETRVCWDLIYRAHIPHRSVDVAKIRLKSRDDRVEDFAGRDGRVNHRGVAFPLGQALQIRRGSRRKNDRCTKRDASDKGPDQSRSNADPERAETKVPGKSVRFNCQSKHEECGD